MKIHLVPRLSILVLLLSGLAGAQVPDPLPSWNDGTAKRTILAFVRGTTDPSSPGFVPPGQRSADFDQEGAAWAVYQPMRELERYLRANGYVTVNEGGQGPVRIHAEHVYGAPPKQVIGTGSLVSGNSLALLVLHDDAQREHPCEPACGQPANPLGAPDQTFSGQAQSNGWVVISMRNDWKRRFASEDSGPWDPSPPGLWFAPEPTVAVSGRASDSSSVPAL